MSAAPLGHVALDPAPAPAGAVDAPAVDAPAARAAAVVTMLVAALVAKLCELFRQLDERTWGATPACLAPLPDRLHDLTQRWWLQYLDRYRAAGPEGDPTRVDPVQFWPDRIQMALILLVATMSVATRHDRTAAEAEAAWNATRRVAGRWAFMLVFRELTFAATRLPSPVLQPRPWGSRTLYDLQISGHSFSYAVLAWAARTWCPRHRWLHHVTKALEVVGYTASIVSREHYTSDVLIAIVLSYGWILQPDPLVPRPAPGARDRMAH